MIKYSDPSLSETLEQEQSEILFEYSLRTFKEAEILKKTTYLQRKQLLQEQFEEKCKEELMNKQIRKGQVTNEERMKKISIRNKYSVSYKEVKQQIQLSLRSDPNKYKLFLIGIITQGIVRMFEDKLLVRCLPEDESIVQDVLDDCIESFHGIMNFQLGRQYNLQISVDKTNPLRKMPQHKVFLQKEQEMMYTIGGVILTSLDGNITYKNTIDCRLNILRELALPDIRAQIWEDCKYSEWDQQDLIQ